MKHYKPALAVLRQPAAQPRGGGPHQLAVVPRGRGEDEPLHRAGGELGDLTEPGPDGLGPLPAQVPGPTAGGLVEVLSNFEPVNSSAVRAVVPGGRKCFLVANSKSYTSPINKTYFHSQLEALLHDE